MTKPIFETIIKTIILGNEILAEIAKEKEDYE